MLNNYTKYPWEPEEIFMQSDKYDIYPEYDEERMSYVDEDKNVVVHDSCINISQENYSQYIPFEMDRKYQGIDLMDMDLQIYFVNSQMGAGSFRAVNVSCSENRIRFGWLVDTRATGVSGDLLFEIRAIGEVQDSNGTKKPYVWKSKQNSQITVLKALAGDLTYEPTQDWYSDAVSYFSDVRDETLGYKNAAASSQAAASTSEMNAAGSEENAKTYELSAKTSETNAAASEATALQHKNDAADSATLAKSWAVGGTSTRADEETNNAKYWSDTTKGWLNVYKTEINNNINSFKVDVNGDINDFITEFTNRVTELQAEDTALATSISAEKSRAESAETTLQENMNTVSANLTSEISRAQQAESDLIVDINGVSNELATEVSRATQVENGLDSRLSVAETKLATHNTSIETINSNIQAINTTLPTKATITDVNNALAAKADVTALNDAVSTINGNKADAATVATLSTSVDTLNASVNVMATTFDNKADKTYVDNQLANKSDSGHKHNYIHIGTEAPTDTNVVLWVDTVNGLKYYNGSAWVNVPVATN